MRLWRFSMSGPAYSWDWGGWDTILRDMREGAIPPTLLPSRTSGLRFSQAMSFFHALSWTLSCSLSEGGDGARLLLRAFVVPAAFRWRGCWDLDVYLL